MVYTFTLTAKTKIPFISKQTENKKRNIGLSTYNPNEFSYVRLNTGQSPYW